LAVLRVEGKDHDVSSMVILVSTFAGIHDPGREAAITTRCPFAAVRRTAYGDAQAEGVAVAVGASLGHHRSRLL